MAVTAQHQHGHGEARGAIAPLLPGLAALAPVLLCLSLLYGLTILDLAREVWPDPQQGHGPFILAIALGAAAARIRLFLGIEGSAPVAGTAVLLLGLAAYALGRSQEILLFETASILPVIAGSVLILKGWPGLRLLWFPVVFLGFWIVWPGWLIDGVTQPLKILLSDATVELLYRLGFPVGHSGVAITIGAYQVLIADACSGLNSLLTLTAVGVLYLYICKYRSLTRNLVILAALVPIAIFANWLRVIALTLITYAFGAEAGEGFVHDFTGLFLFSTALLGVLALDGLIGLGGVFSRARRAGP
ncbi:MAG: exosortase [Alphaproteobacteria bacterium]|nr:exosortase [Alphaproteobacteria bacterium]